MTPRIVVSCRMNGEEVSQPGSRYLERARALTAHAEARGGTLAAWSATTMAFAWDTDSLDEAIDFAGEAATSDVSWAVAIARGELEPLAEKGGEKARGRADLAWGEALFAAVILARAARAGEVVVEASFEGLDALVKTRKRVSRDGERRVRGFRIDARHPWKKDLVANVERLKPPAYLPRADVRPFLSRPGVVHVVRADPGHGGTRMLTEIARAAAPAASIVVSPAGASVEPLGALRRALIRSLATMPYPNEPELADPLDRFLGGAGASIEQAAAILSALLRPQKVADPPSVLLLDDASEIDAESLEACAQVVAWSSTPFHVIVRIDATDQVPSALGALPRGKEVELGPLEKGAGEALAKETTAGALGDRSARRVARRAGYSALGIVEAVAYGLTTGDIAWGAERASLRTSASLAGKPVKAAYWIGKRAKATDSDERGVLATIALFGGEAMKETIKDTLKRVQPEIDVDVEMKKLIARKWLVEPQRAWVALPSRTHRDTIAELLDESPRRALHRAIADVLESGEGELACAEAADHAVKAGEGERGSRLALRAARAAAAVGMSKSANRLLTLARLADPKSEPLTRQALLTSLPPPVPPPVPPSSTHGPPALPAGHFNRAPLVPPAPSAPRPAAPASSSFVDRGVRAPPPPPSAPPRKAPVPPASKPSGVIPPPPSSRAVNDDAPTERLGVMNVAQAAGLLAMSDAADASARLDAKETRQETRQETRREIDSDLPTTIKKLIPALDRATEVDPIPIFESPPEERRGLVPRLPKSMPPLPLPPSSARAADPAHRAPPPLPPPVPAAPRSSPQVPGVRRASTQGMPAVAPRVTPKGEPPAPPVSSPKVSIPPPLPAAAMAAVAPSAPAVAPPPAPPAPPAAVVAPSLPAAASPGPAVADTANAVATRMIDLAKSALLQGDVAAIDRWTEGLRAAGEHDRLAERIEAIARLSRGQVGEALRSLRLLRAAADGGSASSKAQASLALGVGLAAADRADEALLAGLEALARAREGGDPRATAACLAFLAKLYAQAQRSHEATVLLTAARPR